MDLLLEWEAFLSQPLMDKDLVKRLGQKNRYIMYIMRNVAHRTAGMGLKIMKFHAIIHMQQDITLYGVPSEIDTGSNESHHKPTKAAAKMTQRKESSFHFQTATRMTEFLAIDLALQEIEEDFGLWEYFSQANGEEIDVLANNLVELSVEKAPSDNDSQAEDEESQPEDGELLQLVDRSDDSSDGSEGNASNSEGNASNSSTTDQEEEEIVVRTGGTRIRIIKEDDDHLTFKILGKSKSRHSTEWMDDVLQFLHQLQEKLEPMLFPSKHIEVWTDHKRGDTAFRGHPNYCSDGPWKDWALVDWGGHGVLPSHTWCFVDLRHIPLINQPIDHGGIQVKNNVYAVVEVAEYNEDQEEIQMSDLFVPLTLITEGIDENDGMVIARKFWLADVEAIVGTCCVVPDMGGNANAYFLVKPRTDWAEIFIQWLKEPHYNDKMEFSDEEEEQEDED